MRPSCRRPDGRHRHRRRDRHADQDAGRCSQGSCGRPFTWQGTEQVCLATQLGRKAGKWSRKQLEFPNSGRRLDQIRTYFLHDDAPETLFRRRLGERDPGPAPSRRPLWSGLPADAVSFAPNPDHQMQEARLPDTAGAALPALHGPSAVHASIGFDDDLFTVLDGSVPGPLRRQKGRTRSPWRVGISPPSRTSSRSGLNPRGTPGKAAAPAGSPPNAAPLGAGLRGHTGRRLPSARLDGANRDHWRRSPLPFEGGQGHRPRRDRRRRPSPGSAHADTLEGDGVIRCGSRSDLIRGGRDDGNHGQRGMARIGSGDLLDGNFGNDRLRCTAVPAAASARTRFRGGGDAARRRQARDPR